MKRVKTGAAVIVFCIGTAFLGYSWFAENVIYSDFQWIDEHRFLALRSLYSEGAAEVVRRERLLVDTERKLALPLEGTVNGFAVGQDPSRVFIALDHDILPDRCILWYREHLDARKRGTDTAFRCASRGSAGLSCE